jgi:hypothetical protein
VVSKSEPDAGWGIPSCDCIPPLICRLLRKIRSVEREMALEVEGVVDGGVYAEKRYTEGADLNRWIFRSRRRTRTVS